MSKCLRKNLRTVEVTPLSRAHFALQIIPLGVPALCDQHSRLAGSSFANLQKQTSRRQNSDATSADGTSGSSCTAGCTSLDPDVAETQDLVASESRSTSPGLGCTNGEDFSHEVLYPSEKVGLSSEGKGSGTKSSDFSQSENPRASATVTPQVQQRSQSDENHLLMRLVDDFIYITTDLAAAENFVHTLHKGMPSYGCTVQAEKTTTTFQTELDAKSSSKGGVSKTKSAIGQGEPGFVRWCGLRFNKRTLEVQADYSRYCGEDLRDAMTVEATAAVGSTLRRRLFSFLRPKCHAVLLVRSLCERLRSPLDRA
eukprot:SAG31_NODE_201_length_20535_cov_15.315081_14_plen_312_part_00